MNDMRTLVIIPQRGQNICRNTSNNSLPAVHRDQQAPFSLTSARITLQLQHNGDHHLHLLLNTSSSDHHILQYASTMRMSNASNKSVLVETTVSVTIPPAHISRMRNWCSHMTSRMMSTAVSILLRIQVRPAPHIVNCPHSPCLTLT